MTSLRNSSGDGTSSKKFIIPQGNQCTRRKGDNKGQGQGKVKMETRSTDMRERNMMRPEGEGNTLNKTAGVGKKNDEGCSFLGLKANPS